MQAELTKMFAFADKVRSGEWTGVTGARVRTVVNIGIGGSDLGPVMAYEALKPYVQDGLEVRFVSNIDPSDLAEKVKGLDPTTTLFIVASKTFGTLETLTNARLARDLALGAAGHGRRRRVAQRRRRQALRRRLHRPGQGRRVRHRPHQRVRLLGLGRRPLLRRLDDRHLAGHRRRPRRVPASSSPGFHAVDEHVATTPFAQNVPVLMGLLNVWYVNFLGAHTHAVLPYAQYLHRFAAYLQQLTMESNGKSVRWDGTPVTTQTGEVFWGEPGTNGQHAFYQLIHQGTRLIPADFIAVANPAHPLARRRRRRARAVPGQLLRADQGARVRQDRRRGPRRGDRRGHRARPRVLREPPDHVDPRRRPSRRACSGQLIALYEHITFVQGVVWGIDSFDQWGVELGKKLALEIAPAVQGDAAALAAQDPSTRALISRYLELRA